MSRKYQVRAVESRFFRYVIDRVGEGIDSEPEDREMICAMCQHAVGEIMPKTNLCEDKMKKRVDYVAGLLRGGFRQNNLSTADVSAKSGIPTRTVTDRLLHPEKIRLKDLFKLADIAGVKITFENKDVPE